MTDEQFEALVGRLEADAKRNPAGYSTRVLLMALFGYVYLGVVLLLFAALFVGALASVVSLKAAGVKIAVVMAAFLWVVLKALWVRFSPPQGTEIKPREAPELFAMIEELRRALRSPRFRRLRAQVPLDARLAHRLTGPCEPMRGDRMQVVGMSA